MPRYIVPEKLIDILNPKGVDDPLVRLQDIMRAIAMTPKEDAAPVVHSHWIHTGEYLTNSDGERLMKLSDLYVCHRCHRVEEMPEPYCNCGAKMDEDMKEDTEEDV